MDTVETWSNIRPAVCKVAESGQLIPFLGAVLSFFQPTNLPLGDGLLRATLQGAFPDKFLFLRQEMSDFERAILSHSPEVILQASRGVTVTRDTHQSV